MRQKNLQTFQRFDQSQMPGNQTGQLGANSANRRCNVYHSSHAIPVIIFG